MPNKRICALLPSSSMKAKMTVAVVLLTATLLATTAWLFFQFFRQELKESISRQQFALVSAMAEEVDGKIRTARDHLAAMARMVPSEAVADPDRARAFLQSQHDNRVLFDSGLFLFTPEGQLLASMTDTTGSGVGVPPYVIWINKTAREKRVLVSEPFSLDRSPPRPQIMFSAPVVAADGAVSAVLAANLDLMGDNFLGRLAEIRLGEGGYLYLYNQGRTLIVHPDRSRILKNDVPPGVNRMFDQALTGFEGTGETVTSWGLHALSSFKRLPTTGWILAANFPVTEAYASIETARRSFVVGLAAMMLLSSLTVWWLMRRLTAPLATLTEQIREFSGRELPAPIAVETRDEIGELAEAFNLMLARLAGKERALEGQLHFLQVLVDAMPNPVFFKDAAGRYLGCNRGFEEYLGISRQELIGRTVHDLAPPELAQVYRRSDDELLAQGAGSVQTYESEVQYADGVRRPVIFFKAAFADADGGLGGLVGTILDISDRKQAEVALEEQKRFSEKLLESAAAAAFVLDADHRVLAWNPACEALTGVRAEAVVGTGEHWRAFYPCRRPCLADFVLSGRNDELAGFYPDCRPSELVPEGLVAEGWLVLTGRRRYSVFNAAPIRSGDGRLLAAVETLEDITERKAAQDDLEHSFSLLRATMDSTADGILVIDLAGKIVSYNRQFAETWRLPDKVLAAGDGRKTLVSFLRQLKSPAVFSTRIRELETDSEQESRDMVVFRDGRVIDLFSRPQRLADKIVGRVWSFRDVTRQQQMLNQLRQLSLTVEQSPNLIVITDATGSIEYVNRRFVEATGYFPSEVIGRNPRLLQAGDTPPEYFRSLWETITSGREWRGEFHNLRKNGEPYWESAQISPLTDPDGAITHFVAIKTDITARKRAERKERLSAQILRLMALSKDQTDKVLGILHLLRDFSGCEAVAIRLRQQDDFPYYRSLGLDKSFITAESHLVHEGGLVDCCCGRVLLGRLDPDRPGVTAGGSYWSGSGEADGLPRRCLRDGFPSLALIPLRDGDAIIGLMQVMDRRPEMIQLELVEALESLGSSIGIALGHQQTEKTLEEKENRLHFLSNYDALTGLPNRSLLNDRLQHAMAKADRFDKKVALLFLDIDRFKTIKDTLGHEFGDQLLCQTAERLRSVMREADTLGRFSGDKFVVILEEVDDLKQVLQVWQKLRQRISEGIPMEEGHALYLTASIGISLYPGDAGTLEGLFQCAEAAMYRAKESGRNACQFYRPEMNARGKELLVLEGSLRQALEKDQLVLFYQPKIELVSGRVTGVEALLRWRHPDRGMVSPADFIPLAEETGLIVPIGEWVLETACRQAASWQQMGLPPLRVAVNISGIQFRQDDFVDMVDRVVARTGIETSLLELEITESVIMADVEEAIMTLTDLKARGIDLAVDDFGTGYSSLSYLKRFPISTLKIDRSFVREVNIDPHDSAIATSVIALARAMNLQVVAEGIETEEQLRFLVEHGCAVGQGYLFAKPLPAAELSAFVEQRQGQP